MNCQIRRFALLVIACSILSCTAAGLSAQEPQTAAAQKAEPEKVSPLPQRKLSSGFKLFKKAQPVQPPRRDSNTMSSEQRRHRTLHSTRPLRRSPNANATAEFHATDAELNSKKQNSPAAFVQQGIVLQSPVAHAATACPTCEQSQCGCHAPAPQPVSDRKQLNFRDEYLCDGGDRKKPVSVDENYNISGLQTEDTFGHYDTLHGETVVSPSNKICVYAPRFAAVRRIDGVYNARHNQRVNAFEKEQVVNVSRGKDFSASANQKTPLGNYGGTHRASGLETKTRGVLTDQAVQLIGVRDSFSAYENMELIKWGKHSSGETARLQMGMQAANVWQDNLRLQVNAKGAQPVIVNDLSVAHQVVVIDSDFDTTLRVTKIASRIAAEPGEEVEFTIRFDNLSNQPIGNVTIVDNLTGRLQYVPDSAESTLKARFFEEPNSNGSLILKWDIIAPIKAHKGGIVRFKCLVK